MRAERCYGTAEWFSGAAENVSYRAECACGRAEGCFLLGLSIKRTWVLIRLKGLLNESEIYFKKIALKPVTFLETSIIGIDNRRQKNLF